LARSKAFANAAARIGRLAMSGWESRIGRSLRAAEREVERAAFDGPLLDLTYANTHRFPPPEWALDEFIRAASGAGMTYTPYAGDLGVRKAVASNVRAAFDIRADADTVLLTPGTQAGLFTALSALVDHGDEVLLADPEYLSTERMLHYVGARVTHIPLLRDGTGQARLEIGALEAAMARRPALLVFSNPNNPTGAVHTRESIESIAELSSAYDVPVLVDQLYCRLLYEGTPFHHLAAVGDMGERTVTLLGPSKTESLSGFRVGVAVAPPVLAERMEDVLSIAALRAPAYAQHILARWLVDDQDYVADRILEYRKLRDMAVEQFSTTDLIEVEPARGTAYLFPRCNAEVADHELALALKTRAGLVVNPGYQFGPRGVGHFRICFAQDEAAWADALKRIVSTVRAMAENG
jgi:aspartate/methionine/tyrosine aminotransferase